jgi:hypothetical protein
LSVFQDTGMGKVVFVNQRIHQGRGWGEVLEPPLCGFLGATPNCLVPLDGFTTSGKSFIGAAAAFHS